MTDSRTKLEEEFLNYTTKKVRDVHGNPEGSLEDALEEALELKEKKKPDANEEKWI
jgi:hypothetical protein